YDHGEATGRPFLIFELAAVFDEVAGRKRHITLDLRPHFVDEAAEVAPANVRHHHNASLAFVTFDLFRATRHANARDLIECDLFAAGGLERNGSPWMRVGA